MTHDEPMYRHHLIALALEYYVAGRSATLVRLYRVAPILMHHAIELILKAVVIRTTSLSDLRQNHGHDLTDLWQAVVAALPEVGTAARAQTIADLDKFEALRYPDNLVRQGATVSVSLRSGHNPVSQGSKPSSGPSYQFNLEDIDELWANVFVRIANSEAFLQHLSEDARAALTANNQHPIVAPTS